MNRIIFPLSKNKIKLLSSLPYLGIIFFGLLFFFLIVFYYKDSPAFAQEKTVQCEPQIPVGETLERSGELIVDLASNLRTIQDYLYYQIEAAEEMISSTNQCDVSACQPIDCGSYDCTPRVPCSDPLDPGPCWGSPEDCCFAPKTCNGPFPGGRVCPQTDINDSFQKVNSAYNSILAAKKEIGASIEGTDENIDKRVPLCAKENNDIVSDNPVIFLATCSLICQNNPSLTICPQITKLEQISRKLDKSRQGFEGCTVPAADWSKIEQGQVATKSPLACETVIQKDYQRSQPDCRCAPQTPTLPAECGGVNQKSFLNYYCCR